MFFEPFALRAICLLNTDSTQWRVCPLSQFESFGELQTKGVSPGPRLEPKVRPPYDPVYVSGWTISGLAVLVAIVAVWILGI